jgi:sensor domain CHASE-containing protein
VTESGARRGGRHDGEYWGAYAGVLALSRACVRACALVRPGRQSLTPAGARTRIVQGEQRGSTPRMYAFAFVQISAAWPRRRHETDGVCMATTQRQEHDEQI